MNRRVAAVAAALLLGACSGTASPIVRSPSPSGAGAIEGLVAYAADAGIGVLDPATGKSTIVAPLQPGEFRVGGPVWAPAPGLPYPVIYFTVHDDRTPEDRTTPGLQPYDWIFRIDPFAGTIEPVAASQDSISEGPLGLVANSHYLALTSGCCSSYEVDALDLSQPLTNLKVLARPPAQAAFFTEGAAPGSSGLIAVREFGTGTWYWLNADAAVLNPFPVKLGTDDGPVAFAPDGKLAAVALPDQGALIEPINTALPLATPSAAASASPSASPTAASPTATSVAPHHVNSKLQHPDGLAWSTDGKELMIAINGQLQLYSASAPDGTAPLKTFLGGSNVIGVSWSAAIEGKTYANVKPSPGPQAMVDGLVSATRLPAAADTPANRPFTKIYLWQFDSSKSPAPLAAITDATPEILAKYPPIAADVVLHHWAPSITWGFLGGCYRYRVVVTGSIPPAATTIGLADSALCSAKAGSPSP